tara:strand:+ start:214 stop:528 length:315 start_codon:yes stop_codon:yes gene_type:complete
MNDYLSSYDFNALLTDLSKRDVNNVNQCIDVYIEGDVSIQGSIIISHPRGYDEAIYIGNTLIIRNDQGVEFCLSSDQEDALSDIIVDSSNTQRIKALNTNIKNQ